MWYQKTTMTSLTSFLPTSRVSQSQCSLPISLSTRLLAPFEAKAKLGYHSHAQIINYAISERSQ